MALFNDLLTLPSLRDFVRQAKLQRPTAVQRAAIPRLLAGKSVSVLAQTGSGKTLAYALPIVELLKKLESAAPQDEPQARAPRAWIICPTRELGAQIEKVFKSIAHLAKLRVRHLKGGDSRKRARSVVSGPIDVLISSPNRALKALNAGELKSEATRFVIFDEADQLFDRGFLPDVRGLAAKLSSADLQVGLFSATMPSTFGVLRQEAFPGVEFDELVLQGSHTLRNNIATDNYTVPFKDKLEHSVRLLKKTKGPGFVFVNLKRTAEGLVTQLIEALPDRQIYLLHGGMEKLDRRKVLARFVDDGDLLVCTDVASRGLDLPGLSWVLNYDLPFEAVYYVHRCGRVGRTGQPAQVYNLVTTKDRELITRINTAIANQASLKLSRVAERRVTTEKGSADPKGKEQARGRKSERGKAAGAKRPGAKPARKKTASDKPARKKTWDAKPVRKKTSGAEPVRKKTSGARPVRNKTSGARPVRKKTSGARPVRKKTSGAGRKSPTRSGRKGR